MVQPNFLERFKGKTSTMSSLGILQTNPNRAVNLQRFQSKSVMQMSANNILKSTPISKPYTYQPPSSISKPASVVSESTNSPFRSSSRPLGNYHAQPLSKVNLTQYTSDRRLMKYTPYSLKDYQNSQTGKYYYLGGLGPLYVGTSRWMKEKETLEKRIQYGRRVNITNSKKNRKLRAQYAVSDHLNDFNN